MKQVIEDVLKKIPHCIPFRFIDSIDEISETHIIGQCFLDEDSFFYKGHFPLNPITPGYIITEVMAQIGILGLGIYLVNNNYQNVKSAFLTSTNVKFYNISYPNDTIVVKSYLQYYRFGNLKCEISSYNQDGILLCKGIFAGVIK